MERERVRLQRNLHSLNKNQNFQLLAFVKILKGWNAWFITLRKNQFCRRNNCKTFEGGTMSSTHSPSTFDSFHGFSSTFSNLPHESSCETAAIANTIIDCKKTQMLT